MYSGQPLAVASKLLYLDEAALPHPHPSHMQRIPTLAMPSRQILRRTHPVGSIIGSEQASVHRSTAPQRVSFESV